jgi:hypothetical protein
MDVKLLGLTACSITNGYLSLESTGRPHTRQIRIGIVFRLMLHSRLRILVSGRLSASSNESSVKIKQPSSRTRCRRPRGCMRHF